MIEEDEEDDDGDLLGAAASSTSAGNIHMGGCASKTTAEQSLQTPSTEIDMESDKS